MIGLIAAIILGPMLAALLVPHFISSIDGSLASTDSFMRFLAILLALPILLPLLFGGIAFVLAAVARPLCIAWFFRIEGYKEEYGSTKT